MSAKPPKVVNGRPYYPSVEEVMALLHADRANLTDQRSSDEHVNRGDVIESPDMTAEQRILEQEKLRSEVVGRTEPKLAFGDESKDMTSGVLPTTIRRNSPSGSLSSVDSLDEVSNTVPDHTMPSSAVTGSPIAGIIRKGNKVKRDSRVTFNENVSFSDGLVGTLKRKQGGDVTEVMPKKVSYFELPNQLDTTINENGSKMKVEGKGLESSKDSLIFNHYTSKQSKSGVPTTSAQSYPHVNASDIATTGVMTYSMTSNPSRQHTGNLVPTATVNTTEPKANTLYVLPNSPRVNGASLGGRVNQLAESQSAIVGRNGIKNDTRSVGSLSQENKESNAYLNGSTTTAIDPKRHGGSEGNRKDNEGPPSPLPFSSINASMLKDSLEMHNDIRVSQSDPNVHTQSTQQPGVVSCGPNMGPGVPSSSGYITTHAEIPPETPLVPVTKRDFLSKALRSDSDGISSANTKSMSDHPRSQLSREEFVCDGMTESTTDTYGNSGPITEGSSFPGYTMYSDVPGNSRILLEQSDRFIQSNGDRTRPHDNDSYSQRRSVVSSNGTKDNIASSAYNDKHSDRTKQSAPDDSQRVYDTPGSRGIREGKSYSGTTVDIPKYNGITHPIDYINGSVKHGHQLITRDNQGMQRPNKTNGDKSSAIPPRSRSDPNINTEKFTTTQDGTTNRSSFRPSLGNGQQNFTSRKAGSADDLLRNVQKNIERISMTPAQQGVPRTNSATLDPSSYEGRYKSAASEGRHNATTSENVARPSASDKPNMTPASESRVKSASFGHERKLTNRKAVPKPKLGEAKKMDGNNKRLHKNGSNSGIGNQRSVIKTDYGAMQNANHEISTVVPNSDKNLSSRVHSVSNHRSDHHSPSYRLYGVPPENRAPQPSWTNTFERKQRMNSERLAFLDKTPTDEEIDTLWETVRTCLKHEQPQKAASDSIVNNVRYSRSESGPLVGSHYLIDGNAWAPKHANGARSASDNETRQSRGTASIHFRRQGSLDSLRRGTTEGIGYIPPRKGSLLQHRSSASDRRLPPRGSQSGRPPVNPQYLHSLRGPVTSNRGPQKSNIVKPEEPRRPQLSYAEFQAVMQASADIKTRNTEGDGPKNPRQGLHQPIIMNHRKGKGDNY